MAATAQGIEIEQLEEKLGFSVVQLEATTTDNRAAFLDAARSALYGKIHNERVAELAMVTLTKLPTGIGTEEQRAAIAQLAFSDFPPATMN